MSLENNNVFFSIECCVINPWSLNTNEEIILMKTIIIILIVIARIYFEK